MLRWIMWMFGASLLTGVAFASAQEKQAPQGTSETSASQAPDLIPADTLRAAWAKLDAAGKREAAEWFTQEVRALPIFQNALITYLKGRLDKDPYDWPAPQANPVFDPVVHAPAQPIPRVPVAQDSAAYQKQWKRLVGFRHLRPLKSAWSYDYARRTVVRERDFRDPELLFENGLSGFAPDLDLAEALCQLHLDDGSAQATHQAFGHTYAIRTGASFPGITLYDAWSSGQTIEMPDVECLGLLHTLENDWKSFVAPVSRQKPLYQRIEDLYVPIHRARALQTSLARCYLISTPALDDGYAGTETFLNHLWEQHSSDPARLRAELPTSKKWERWMESGQKKLRANKKALEIANGRREHLAYGERQVRQAWERVLKGMGVLTQDQTR